MDIRPGGRISDQSLNGDRSGRSSGRGPEGRFGTVGTGFEALANNRFRAEAGFDKERPPWRGTVDDRCAPKALVGMVLKVEGLGVGERRILSPAMAADLKRRWQRCCRQQHGSQRPNPAGRAEPHLSKVAWAGVPRVCSWPRAEYIGPMRCWLVNGVRRVLAALVLLSGGAAPVLEAIQHRDEGPQVVHIEAASVVHHSDQCTTAVPLRSQLASDVPVLALAPLAEPASPLMFDRSTKPQDSPAGSPRSRAPPVSILS